MWPHAVRAVRAIRPRAFLFENVAGLLKRKFAAYRRDVILGPLRRLGYGVEMRLLVCADYGVPQLRPRVFTVGLKGGLTWEWPAPTHAEDALLHAQWVDGSYWREHGLAAPDVPTRLVETVERLRPPPLARWRTVRDALGGGGPPVLERPPKAGETKAPLRNTWDWPALTITTWQDSRALLIGGDATHRLLANEEVKALFGFPPEWRLAGSPDSWPRQLGNAVPPGMAAVLMKALAAILG